MALNKVGDGNVTGGPLPGYEANRAFLQPEAAGLPSGRSSGSWRRVVWG